MTTIVFGANETPHLGEGWHERESWGDERVYRYTSQRAVARVDADWSGRSIALLLSASASVAGGRVEVTLSGEASGEVVNGQCYEIEGDDWRIVEWRLPDRLEQDSVLIIETAPTIVPDQALGNGDQRRLGVRVASIRIGD